MGRGGGGEPGRLGSLREAGWWWGSSRVLALVAAGYGTPDLAQQLQCCCVGALDALICRPPTARVRVPGPGREGRNDFGGWGVASP